MSESTWNEKLQTIITPKNRAKVDSPLTALAKKPRLVRILSGLVAVVLLVLWGKALGDFVKSYAPAHRSSFAAASDGRPEPSGAPRLVPGALLPSLRPPPLSRLGYKADDAYDILKAEDYVETLSDFILQTMPHHLQEPLLSALNSSPTTMRPVPITLHQMSLFQDKEKLEEDAMRSWKKHNPGLKINFWEGASAHTYLKRIFGNSEIVQVFNALDPIVLKADYTRYLLLLIEGGAYSDQDTKCLKPIAGWGHLDNQPVASNGGDHQIANVVVGIEADVDHDGKDFLGAFWDDGLARPLREIVNLSARVLTDIELTEFVQWTLLSSPFHPIFLDTVRRIVVKTRQVEEWRRQQAHELSFLHDSEAGRRLREEKGWQQLNAHFDRAICDWTGPGVFTDAVLSYLGYIEGSTWYDFHGIPKAGEPRLLGDVVVGPMCTFRAFDWHAHLPQAKVQHFFQGTWKNGNH